MIVAWLGAFAVIALPGCDTPDRKAMAMRLPKLPHAVLIDDGTGRRRHVHIAAVVDAGVFTSGFGTRDHPMGGGSAHHEGIDIAAAAGSAVRAATTGTVAEVGWHGSYGRFIRIRHSGELETAYAHLSRFARGLKVGARVRQDDVVGYVGSSGLSSGPHLHFEIRYRGRAIDPLSLPPVAEGR